MKTFRIIFTIVCAVCLASLPLVGIFWWDFIVIPIVVAGVSFLLMLSCRKKQMQAEESLESSPVGDFLDPKPTPSATESDSSESLSTEAEAETHPEPQPKAQPEAEKEAIPIEEAGIKTE